MRRNLLESLHNASNGFKWLLKERNFKLQMLLGLVILTVGAIFKLDKYDYYWLLLGSFMIMTFEGINTVVEKLVDMIQPQYDERAKVIKDMAAALVLFGSTMPALIVSSILFKAIFGLHFVVGILFGIILVILLFFLGLFGGGKE